MRLGNLRFFEYRIFDGFRKDMDMGDLKRYMVNRDYDESHYSTWVNSKRFDTDNIGIIAFDDSDSEEDETVADKKGKGKKREKGDSSSSSSSSHSKEEKPKRFHWHLTKTKPYVYKMISDVPFLKDDLEMRQPYHGVKTYTYSEDFKEDGTVDRKTNYNNADAVASTPDNRYKSVKEDSCNFVRPFRFEEKNAPVRFSFNDSHETLVTLDKEKKQKTKTSPPSPSPSSFPSPSSPSPSRSRSSFASSSSSRNQKGPTVGVNSSSSVNNGRQYPGGPSSVSNPNPNSRLTAIMARTNPKWHEDMDKMEIREACGIRKSKQNVKKGDRTDEETGATSLSRANSKKPTDTPYTPPSSSSSSSPPLSFPPPSTIPHTTTTTTTTTTTNATTAATATATTTPTAPVASANRDERNGGGTSSSTLPPGHSSTLRDDQKRKTDEKKFFSGFDGSSWLKITPKKSLVKVMDSLNSEDSRDEILELKRNDPLKARDAAMKVVDQSTESITKANEGDKKRNRSIFAVSDNDDDDDDEDDDDEDEDEGEEKEEDEDQENKSMVEPDENKPPPVSPIPIEKKRRFKVPSATEVYEDNSSSLIDNIRLIKKFKISNK
jgi:hypothetical protein